MKKYILSFALLLSISNCFSQVGYSQWYDFDLTASFHNVILKGDTLIIAGTAIDPNTDQWGALFVKMDTLGNVLDHQLHIDPMDGQYAFEKGYSIISTPDGGYLLLGLVFNREAFFVLKLDINGHLEHFWEYPEPPNNLTNLPRKIVEVSNGYMIFSKLQESDGTNDVFLTKINYEGEKLWEQSYGADNKTEAENSVWVKDDNTIVIGALKQTNQITHPPPSPVYCSQNWIFAIDSLGTVKWEWVSEPCEAGVVVGLQPTPDGGWVYGSSRLQVFDQWNLGFAPLFIKRDSEFNLVWEKQLADSYSPYNKMIDIKPTQEGDWIGASRWILPEPYTDLVAGDHAYLPACLFKYTDEGDSLWIRCDTIALDNEYSAGSHEYGGIVVLPSGSTIAVGSFRMSLGNTGNTLAWVVKVDKNGCMEELCTITGVEDLKEKISLSVYPNPAQGLVIFENTKSSQATLRVVDIAGKTLWKEAFLDGQQRIEWTTTHIPNGLYFYQLIEHGQVVDSGKVVIQK